MLEYGFLIIIGFLIYLFTNYNSITRDFKESTVHIKKLDARIRELDARIKDLELNPSKTETKTEIAASIVPEKEPDVQEDLVDSFRKLPFIVTEYDQEVIIEPKVKETPTPEIKVEELKPQPYFAASEKATVGITQKPVNREVKPPIIKNKNEFWTKIEKQFVENWTGILGSVIMVIGVGFLGIYTAVKISPLGRFILISGFAAVLAGLFFFLYKKPKWNKFALWMRSSAGAIFLFACAASVAIPGLKWVETQSLQLFILLFGVVVNLFLGYIGKNQGLASLHVLLSLVAVCIIPASATLLIIGTIITLFGVALTYREKWDYHLLLTASSFFLFHLFYWFNVKYVFTSQDRIIGIITIVLVGISVALVHYREAYGQKNFERVPFIVHLLNWFYFGLGLALYSQGSRISTIILAVGSIAAFILARRAKKLDIRWLYITDTLIAQITAIIALVTLFRWELDLSLIFAAIFVECLLFLFIAKRENDTLLYTFGSIASCIIGFVVLIYSMLVNFIPNNNHLYTQFGAFLAVAIAGTSYIFFVNKLSTQLNSVIVSDANASSEGEARKSVIPNHIILSILIGSLFVSIYINVFQFNWSVYLVTALLVAIIILRNKIQTLEFSLLSIIFLVGAHFVNWSKLFEVQNQSYLQILSVGLPLLIASAFAIKFSFIKSLSKYLNWIGVYLFSLQLIILSYFLFKPISILAVSFAWLAMILIIALVIKFISKKSAQYHQVDRYILHVGYALMGLFLMQFVFVDFKVTELWGPIKGRILVELVSLPVFVYWAMTKNEFNAAYKSWKFLHPVLVETIILFSFITISFELEYRYIPLAYLAMAGITFVLANWKNNSVGRIAFYSFSLFFLALVQQLFVYASVNMYLTSTSSFPTLNFVLACVFITLSLTYLIIFYKRAKLADLHWPVLVEWLNPFGKLLNNYAAVIGVYSYGAFLMLISYSMFQFVSDIIPGIVWLLMAAIFATAAILTYGKKSNFMEVDRYILHLCYWFIGAFLLRHLFVHIHLENSFGIIKVRYLIEALAIVVFTYCATLKKPEATNYKSWTYLHPLFVELLLLFTIFTIALEVDSDWQPMIWVATSFIFALVANSTKGKLSRLVFYALVMYWIAAFQTAFTTSSQLWIYGTISLLLQFAFLLYFYLKCSLENVILPKSLLFLSDLIAVVQKLINAFVFYPLIICTAIFLFWTFDKSLLTLLWVIESLIVFLISIVLRKHHFRYVALAALALCIVRLIFFDLSQSSTLARAIVFLSVGVIMLIMNSLYNKFKSRFE